MNTPIRAISFEDYETQAEIVVLSKRGAKIKLGKEKRQAREGKHTARCMHVEPNWTFLANRKVELYFEIDSGPHAGQRRGDFIHLKSYKMGRMK